MIHTENYRLGAAETDINSIASPSAMLRYMQDVTNRQMEFCSPSYEELFERGLPFILSRITMDFPTPMKSHRRFTGESWANPSRGVTYGRCYRLRDGDTVFAEAVSSWALLNTATGKLMRVGEVALDYGDEPPLELPVPTRFKIPREAELTKKGERTVGYAEADLNGHMNNTRYPDIICSYLGNMRGKRVRSMSISFASEAPLGETVTFYAGEQDGVCYVRSFREDGRVNIEAEVRLCEVEE